MQRFDRLTRTVSTLLTRRTLAGALGLGALSLPSLVEAKKKHKKRKKKKKIKRNAFGCVNVGGFCKNNGQCCSGICQGKKGKKKCQGHDAGTCAADANTCDAGINIPCNANNDACFCTQTTGNASFCGDFSGEITEQCRVCRTDADCEAEFGAGAACLVLGGFCAEFCVATGGTACVAPCPVV